MTTDAGLLGKSTVGEYLIRHGVLPEDSEPTAWPLGGGVSNVVLRVTTDEDCRVVKQSLANLFEDLTVFVQYCNLRVRFY